MMKKYALLAFWSLTFSPLFSQLVVTPNNNGIQLGQIIGGNGVTVSNAIVNCGANGIGSFTNGNTTNLGLTDGVVLATGNITQIPQAGSAFASTDNANGGDPDLNLISNAATQDRCFLQFDVVPVGNSLSFQYVFGSEEYPEYVCSQFNDVFGFFVTGPNPGGGAYNTANIAFIPNTLTTVAINTVNSGTPGAGYTASGCPAGGLNNSQYYVNNQSGSTIVYDGFTTVFSASIAVVPCATYTFKIAIADAGDGAFDSGVFVQGNSFSSVGTTVAASYDPGFSQAFEGCTNGYFTINMPTAATTTAVINYTITGTASNGVDVVNLPGQAFVNPGSTSTIVTVSPLADGATEGLETLTMNIINPCDGSIQSSATININDAPVTTATATPGSICAGQSVQLNATGGGTYSWSGGAVSNSSIANPTASPSSTTTYTVNTTFGNCNNSANVTVNVTNLTFTATATPNSGLCPGDSVALASSLTGGSGNISYNWSGGVNNPSAQNTYAFPTSSTTYSVTATDASGCTASASAPVAVVQLPPVSLGPNQSYCPGQVTTDTLTPSGGPYTSYIWSTQATTPSIIVNSTGTYTVTVVDAATGCEAVSSPITLTFFPPVKPLLSDTGMCPGETIVLTVDAGFTNPLWSNGSSSNTVSVSSNGTFYYIATDPNGCQAFSDTITVTVASAPVVNATASPDTICPGATSTLAANAQGTNLNYLWFPGGELTATIQAGTAGQYIVRVRDAFCSTFDTVQLYSYPNFQPTLSPDQVVCPGASATVSVNGGPYVSYTWSNNQNTPTISVTAIGNYWVTVNNGVCNYVSDTFTLSNFNVITPDAFGDTAVCGAQPVVISGQPDLTNYGWSNNAGSGISVTVTAPGTYTYTATDANNCTVTSSGVTVTHLPVPAANIVASPAAICLGQGSSTLDAGSEPNVNYTWFPGQINAPTIQITQTGTYIVLATNTNNCFSSDTITIFASDSPSINLPPVVRVCCQSVTLDPAPGQNLTFEWSDQSTGSTLAITSTNNADVVYSVTATNAAGCTASDQTIVTIKCIDAAIDASPDTLFVIGDSSVLTLTPAYSNDLTYNWTPASTLNGNGVPVVVARPNETTTYTVFVLDTVDQCTDTAEVQVVVVLSDLLAIPNAFTPNGDGRNDVFGPVLASSFQKVEEFRIYNRWGQLIHNSTENWDGIFEGKEQPAGTYIYYIVISVPDKDNSAQMVDKKFNGSFTLLR